MVATLSPPRILPSGDSAITVEFSREIDDAANQRVLALDRTLASEPVSGVTETVPTGVQCLAGPSGWHLLGRTAVRTYQLHRDPIFLLEPGDAVTFSAIDARTFAEQDRAAEAGEIVAELIAS